MQSRIARLLGVLADGLDRRPALCLTIILVTVIPFAVMKSHSTRLTGDEVYTLRIARQPTVSQMVYLSREIDLHPPLHYFTERAALATHLPIWLASRLPSILATALSMVILFFFVARGSGYLFGLFAACIFWFTPALEFAWLNRPYALWLCFLALTTLVYQHATERPRSSWLPFALFLSGSAMVLDYMAGLACLLPFFVAEATRTYRRRKIDFAIWIALILPCSAILLYLAPVSAFAANSFVPSYLHYFGILGNLYAGLMLQPLAILAACVLAAILIFMSNPRAQEDFAKPALPLSAEADTAAGSSSSVSNVLIGCCILGLPLLLAVIAALRHNQFFSRYGACAAIGFSFLVPAFVFRYVRYSRAVATLMTVALLITAAVQCASANFEIQGIWRVHQAKDAIPLRLDSLDPQLPIVVANAIGYTEMNERESAAVLTRTYYLYDRDSALKFSGSTVFENENKVAALMGFQSKTAPLRPFLAANRQFYMIASFTHPEEWLPRKLAASGATIKYLGKFESTYVDVDLYLVTSAPLAQ